MKRKNKCTLCRKRAVYQMWKSEDSAFGYCSDHLEEGIEQVAGDATAVVVELIG